MKKIYSSKISYGLLVFIFFVSYGPLIKNLTTGELNEKMIGVLIAVSFMFAFVLYTFYNTKYTIDNGILKIKCGFISYKPIDIKEIKEIAKTNDIISSPAASLDRILIKYGQSNKIIISPKNKSDFTKDLTKINPTIKNNITE